jgi:hypothetical protein
MTNECSNHRAQEPSPYDRFRELGDNSDRAVVWRHSSVPLKSNLDCSGSHPFQGAIRRRGQFAACCGGEIDRFLLAIGGAPISVQASGYA